MNALDKLAGKKSPSSKKSTKIAAQVTNEIKKAVDTVIWAKAEIKSMQIQLAENEETIICHVSPQQDTNAYAGNYSKSYLVEGNKGNLTYTTANKFSIPQDDDSQTALKKLLGKKYDEFFETKRTVSLSKKVFEDNTLVDKIIAAIEKAGIDLADALIVTDIIVTKEDIELDKEQYKLPDSKLQEFRTLVRQAKAALK